MGYRSTLFQRAAPHHVAQPDFPLAIGPEISPGQQSHPAVALQVAFERQILKSVFPLDRL
jgi:hypothetical protein